MRMASPKEDGAWINLGFLLIFVFVNSRNITIQVIYNCTKFHKYILVKSLLVCFRNRHQDFPYCNKEEIARFKKVLNTSYFEMDG